MFTLEPEPTFWNEVKIKTPTGVQSFKMEFRHLDRIAVQKWVERASDTGHDDPEKQLEAEVAACMEVCKSWDIKEELTVETMNKLLKNFINASSAIVEAYSDGLVGAAVKN